MLHFFHICVNANVKTKESLSKYHLLRFKSPLRDILRKVWPSLSWESPSDGVKVSHLGCSLEEYEYDDVHFRLIYVEKGAIFPQHCYKEAREILHILYANEMAALGTCEEWTKQIEIDNIFSFLPTEHKILKVCTAPEILKCQSVFF